MQHGRRRCNALATGWPTPSTTANICGLLAGPCLGADGIIGSLLSSLTKIIKDALRAAWQCYGALWVRVRNGTPFTNQMSASTIQQNDTDWGFQVADATQNICNGVMTAEGPSAPTLTLPIHMHTSCIRQAGTRRQTIQMGLSAGPPLWRSSLSCVFFV